MGVFNATSTYGRGFTPTQVADQFLLRVYTGASPANGRPTRELRKRSAPFCRRRAMGHTESLLGGAASCRRISSTRFSSAAVGRAATGGGARRLAAAGRPSANICARNLGRVECVGVRSRPGTCTRAPAPFGCRPTSCLRAAWLSGMCRNRPGHHSVDCPMASNL